MNRRRESDFLLYPIQSPSSVFFSLYDYFICSSSKHLILGKHSSIEVYELDASGLQLAYSLPLEGKLASLAAIKICSKDERKCLVFTLDDGTAHFVVHDNGEFSNIQQLNLKRNIKTPPSGLGHFISVESNFVAIHAYHGYIKLVKLPHLDTFPNNSKGDRVFEAVDIQIKFANVTSMNFIRVKIYQRNSTPILGVIFTPPDDAPVFIAYACAENVVASKKIICEPYSIAIPLPAPLEGYLLTDSWYAIQYVVQVTPKRFQLDEAPSVLDEYPDASRRHPQFFITASDEFDPGRLLEDFSCYAIIDHTRILAVCNDGSLYLLILLVKRGVIKSVKYEFVGYIVPATSLLHISSNIFFVSSHYGPSALFELNPLELSINVIQEFDNLGPILDIAIPSLNVASEPKELEIFTCSGGYRSGYIQKISPGRIFETIAEADVPFGIQNIWFDEISDALIASFANRTEIIQPFSSAPVNPLLLNCDHNTLAFYRTYSHQIQVSSIGIFLINAGKEHRSITFEITCADVSENHIAVYLKSGQVIVYNHELTAIYEIYATSAVSTLSCSEGFLVYSTFSVKEPIHIVDLSTISERVLNLLEYREKFSFRICSLLVFRSFQGFLGVPFLFAATSDCRIFAIRLDRLEVVDTFQRGIEPHRFLACNEYVLAISDKPCEIVLSRKINDPNNKVLLTYNPINTNNSVFAACLGVWDQTKKTQNLITITDQNKLIVSDLNSHFKNALRQIRVPNLVRRICLSPNNEFLLALMLTELSDQHYIPYFASSFSLFNAKTLAHIETAKFSQLEPSVVEAVVPIYNDFSPSDVWFCIATSSHLNKDKMNFSDTPNDSNKGALHVYKFFNGKFSRLSLTETPYPIYDMTISNRRLCVSTHSSIYTYDISNTGELQYNWVNQYVSTPSIGVSLSCNSNRLYVGDLMCGVFYTDITRKEIRKNVQFAAKVEEPHGKWISNLEILPCQQLLVGDIHGNLYVHNMNSKLKPNYHNKFHIGDTVNSIRRIPRNMFYPGVSNRPGSNPENMLLIPSAVVGTVSGGLYILLQTNSDLFYKKLDPLVRRILHVTQPVDITAKSETQLKARSNDKPSTTSSNDVLAGEVLASFLRLSEEAQLEIMGSRKMAHPKLREILDCLKIIG